MAKKTKQLNILAIVLFALVVVGLVLAIVGLCIDVINMTSTLKVLGKTEVTTKGIGLFAEEWANVKELTEISTAFAIVAFIVTIVGLAVLAVDGVLRVFLGKDIALIRIIGAAVAIVGAILILIAGLTLASSLTDKLGGGLGGDVAGASVKYSAAAGIWLGFIGGLVGGVCGGLPLLLKNK